MSVDEHKEACCNAPVLAYADYKQPFILHTDSSLNGLGAVLHQKEGEGKLRVIAYARGSLTKSERNYLAHKLEFLSLKWAVPDKFKGYLYEISSFEVFSNNNALTCLMYVLTTVKLDTTTQRWVAAVALYNFEICYRSGKHDIDADCLSRIKWPECVDEVVANRNSCIGVNFDIVHAVFQGTSIP